MEGLLKGKKGLIMGLANEMSMAWGIAQELSKQGASLAFSYQNTILEKRVTPLAAKLGSDFLIECDVCDNNSLKSAFSNIEQRWGKLDFLVHAIAFSNKEELTGRYIDTSLENFTLTMNVSCYSLVAASKYAAELMKDGGSIITLSYYGAEKAIPNYNVMGVAKAALECSVRYIATDLGKDGIRINTISAGPVRTLAASGISDFRSVLGWTEQNSPLRKNINIHDVGQTALYLISDLSSGVTGEVIHVDSGYHSIGMKMNKDKD
jgi:enoyl-[acyl-carrier protein] reductase I